MKEIVLVGQRDNGFVVPSESSWDVALVDGKKEGKGEVKDKNGFVSAVLFYHNDKLNGVCEFYDTGTLIKMISYVDDVPEGWACDIENYEQVRWYIYAKGVKKSTLKKCDTMKDYWEERDINTNQLISICKYDKNHLVDGKGYLFENGHISRIIWFDHGKQKDIMKVFEEDQMTEYEDTGNKVYEGGFKDDLLDYYPREGQGMEFAGGIIAYKGEWKKNKKNGKGKTLVNGYAEYEGEWKDGLPNGKGVLVRSPEEVYKGDWNNGILKVNEIEFYDYKKRCLRRRLVQVEIKNENQLKELFSNQDKRFGMSELVIGVGCGNEMKGDLDLCEFNNLESLIVKGQSLQNLNSLKISNNPWLKTIEVKGGNGGSKDSSKNTSPFHYVKSVVISGSLFD